MGMRCLMGMAMVQGNPARVDVTVVRELLKGVMVYCRSKDGQNHRTRDCNDQRAGNTKPYTARGSPERCNPNDTHS